MFFSNLTVSVVVVCFFFNYISCQDSAMEEFFKKASKNIPRIGRSNSKSSKGSNDDFENFFLKASKSVPRIGRRDRGEFELESGKKWMKVPKIDPFTSESESLQIPTFRGEVGDKINSGAAVLPLPEISKYKEELNEEEIRNAFDRALEASRMKEMERVDRIFN